MEEKKYLKLKNKLAYGSGDMASNFCYTFVTSFVLIYLTNAVGLNSGLIGTLMLVSRILDGITDVLFGTLVDRTKSKLGKARPWMLYTIIPMIACEILLYCVPKAEGALPYVYFFVFYTLLNDVFYTASNIAYSTLAVLITKNKEEQVQLGAFRFIFTMIAAIIVSGGTMTFVEKLGNTTAAWRTVAIIYSVAFGVIMLLCVLGTKEIEDGTVGENNAKKRDLSLLKTLYYIIRNPYFIGLLVVTILSQTMINMATSVGTFYTTYVLGDSSKLMLFTLTQMLPMIVGLIFSPALVKKLGVHKSIMVGLFISLVACVPLMIFGQNNMLAGILTANSFRWLGMGPLSASAAALTADISAYTMQKDQVDIVGAMFSCSSMGNKLGGGIGAALCGWILEWSGYDGTAVVQNAATVSALKFLYTGAPLVFGAIILLIFCFMNVEKKLEN